MSIHEVIDRACNDVGIVPPKAVSYGKWLRTDTLSGRKGKNDAQIMVNERYVTAMNFQTGETVTLGTGDRPETPKDRRIVAQQIRLEKEKKQARADRAAKVASRMVDSTTLATHPYLASKGFREEPALVIDAEYLRRHVGDYLVAGERAIVMPARKGSAITSVQLIWEDGIKKFLAGGEISGSCHRIAKGPVTWLCEGFATGLSLRAALKSLSRPDAVLCCFSASNVAAVARSVQGKCFIAADHDKPMPQFDGLGTGEHWAKIAGKPYAMPPEPGDINDMHQERGIFAVQKLVTDLIKRAR